MACTPASAGFCCFGWVFDRFHTISGTPGGPVPRYFAMRLEFIAVAVSNNLLEKVPFQEEENKPGTFSGRRKKINPAPFPHFLN